MNLFVVRLLRWDHIFCLNRRKREQNNEYRSKKIYIKNITTRWLSIILVLPWKRDNLWRSLEEMDQAKSTTIKSILGLKQPTSGEIILPKNIQIGYLPEERGVYADATVEEHLMLFAELSGVKDIDEKKSIFG